MENIPAWLETLWNINPSLAERAQVDVERWHKLEQSESKLNLQNVTDTVCCENCLHFYHDTKTCDKTCMEYDKFKHQTRL